MTHLQSLLILFIMHLYEMTVFSHRDLGKECKNACLLTATMYVFLMVARVLLCSCYGIPGVSRVFLWCCLCYTISIVFIMVLLYSFYGGSSCFQGVAIQLLWSCYSVGVVLLLLSNV